jgi:hypothetical protein
MTFTASITNSATLAVALRETEDFIKKYIVLTVDQATVLALWIAHTHAFKAFDTTPYLHLGSATKRAGKTRTLEVCETLVPNPWLTGRTSAAALVRKIDGDKPTLLLDESDAAFKQDREYAESLRSILNSGYKASGRASLCAGKGADLRVRDFETFCPKVIAGIGKLPDTIADRSIPIMLRRKTTAEPVARWRDRDGRAEGHRIRSRFAACATADTVAKLREARPELPDALGDRAQDVWEPLFAIADMAGGDWPTRARRAALTLMGSVEDEDPVVLLLADIAAILNDADSPVIATKSIIERLIAAEERPWASWHRDKPITARGLAGLLGPLGIHPIHLRDVRGYRRDAFDDAFARYLPSQASQRHQPNENGPELRDGSDVGGGRRNPQVSHGFANETGPA